MKQCHIIKNSNLIRNLLFVNIGFKLGNMVITISSLNLLTCYKTISSYGTELS